MDAPSHLRAVRIAVHGSVQGIGFRPEMNRRAARARLAGFVRNTPFGAELSIQGPTESVLSFLAELTDAPPPHARIDRMDIEDIPADPALSGFVIETSHAADAPTAAMTPDLATCPDCLRELLAPSDRRHRYPFLNCTRCGPRFSIQLRIPYDRANTTMRRFTMCPDCQREYDDPADRRFHAQPNACPVCGPSLRLLDASGHPLAEKDDALRSARDRLRDGQILAVKGLGGFHLIADAMNPDAVSRLRERKRREEKPFAVMMPDLESLRRYVHVTPAEEAELLSPAAPILLLPKRQDTPVPEAVAPGQAALGCFLPYTPLHHLLLEGFTTPVIATSANLSDEPICTRTAEILDKLGQVVDAVLTHDRPIARPVDDSVVRVIAGEARVFRRSRGYAPRPVITGAPDPGATILAVGGHLKNTVALLHRGSLILSQHLGDLETVASHEAFEEAIRVLLDLYRVKPDVVVCDKHPDYLSTRHARGMTGVGAVEIQHHVAHIASCMAEHNLRREVFGLAWDGTGYGDDGTAWGSECMTVNRDGYTRHACLLPFPLPGGAAAIREPGRAAAGLLHRCFGTDEARRMLEPIGLADAAAELAWQRLDRDPDVFPLASGMGRLFDIVAVLAGLAGRSTFEGQAAMTVEAALEPDWHTHTPYPLSITHPPSTINHQPSTINHSPSPIPLIDPTDLLLAVLDDRRRGVAPSVIAARFHLALLDLIERLARDAEPVDVILTGGCFQNASLLEGAMERVKTAGKTPRTHARIPAGDGGLSAGQAWMAMWQTLAG